jgi:hypothetical protein
MFLEPLAIVIGRKIFEESVCARFEPCVTRHLSRSRYPLQDAGTYRTRLRRRGR